jgi:hypothetical protein
LNTFAMCIATLNISVNRQTLYMYSKSIFNIVVMFLTNHSAGRNNMEWYICVPPHPPLIYLSEWTLTVLSAPSENNIIQVWAIFTESLVTKICQCSSKRTLSGGCLARTTHIFDRNYDKIIVNDVFKCHLHL